MTVVRERAWFDGDNLKFDRITDNSAIHNDNDDRKKDPSRGFSPERTLQHIGRIPCDVYHAWAMKIGYYQMDKDKKKAELIKFLQENPQWSPVERLVNHGANDSHIIIK